MKTGSEKIVVGKSRQFVMDTLDQLDDFAEDWKLVGF